MTRKSLQKSCLLKAARTWLSPTSRSCEPCCVWPWVYPQLPSGLWMFTTEGSVSSGSLFTWEGHTSCLQNGTQRALVMACLATFMLEQEKSTSFPTVASMVRSCSALSVSFCLLAVYSSWDVAVGEGFVSCRVNKRGEPMLINLNQTAHMHADGVHY